MFKHVVMWRFKGDEQCRRKHAEWMKAHLENLVGVVPEIRSLEVGINVSDNPMAYDAVLMVLFDDAEALARYKVHPAHQEVSAYCKSVRESRTVVDFLSTYNLKN